MISKINVIQHSASKQSPCLVGKCMKSPLSLSEFINICNQILENNSWGRDEVTTHEFYQALYESGLIKTNKRVLKVTLDRDLIKLLE